ncbi:MAG: phosphotransferase, partial [Kitasatospora sp.]|nr:phosphotransferase [Kitasatospora sp.]
MSESLRDLAATAPADPVSPVAPPRPPAPDRALIASLARPLAEWLPRRRWFAGKGRPITDVLPVAVTELLPYQAGPQASGLLHALVQVRQPGLTEDCYQLLLGVRRTLPPRLSPALIGTPREGPLRGRAVYDALQDPRLAAVLLERLRLPGRLGPLRFTQEAGAVIPSASTLPSRLLAAEQSNSSVVYGNALILKVFRRVYPGVNPDLELPLALAHGGRVPAPAAWFETTTVADPDEGPATLGVLQPFLAGSTDGWELALDHLEREADFTGEARDLGRTTAEVHLALAEELPTTVLQTEAIAAAMTERLEATAAAVPALRPHRDALAAAFADLAALGRAGRDFSAQRIHGDLHLGQVLRTLQGWQVIDFE